MAHEITISRGKSEDAETLSRIKQRIWLETYINEEFGITSEDVLAKDFLCKKRIAKRAEHMSSTDETNYTLVARVGSQIVGYGRATKNDKSYEIATLYVLAEWQGKGIGTILLQRLLDWIGNSDVILGVVPYNVNAVRFYEKFGFKLGNRVPHEMPTFPSGMDLPEIEMVRSKKSNKNPKVTTGGT